ncbi:MAG: C10 family peptidase [Planctomycetes bacterium]|nr:C10 family peptidase [Planctomycetota bacterium]
MRTVVGILGLICTTCAWGQSISEGQAQAYVHSWLRSNPLALRDRQTQGLVLEIGETERLVLDSSPPPFYVVHLKPQGYVIVSGDRRLRPVVYFDFVGSPDLGEQKDNPLYQFLLAHGRKNAQTVVSRAGALAAWDLPSALQMLGRGEPNVIGPLLATSWDQGNYYNELCPVAVQAAQSGDGRAPTGCVATAFGQVMKYHQWPYRGMGSSTYTDTSGSITGTHTAVFSDPYDWSHMQNEYYAFGQEPDEAVHAVAELMYELGVAANMDYEAAESTSAVAELASRMRRCFLYETPVYAPSTEGALPAGALLRDLARRRPCLAAIPGHVFVVDGHMRQGTDDFFHVNYGWSGRNDGWCLLEDVQGQAVVETCTGIDPLLTAIPLGSERTAQGWELRWVLPQIRGDEASRLDVLQRQTVSGTWADPAEDFHEFEVTSTSDYKDWVLSPAGYTGTCFHKPASGYLNRAYHLTSSRVFRPGPDTSLTFKAQYKLYEDGLSVLVSKDNGDSFASVWSISKKIQMSWTDIQVPLGPWAGQEVLIRFEYTPGNQSYSGGGVWLDEIRLVSAQWYEWDVIHRVQPLEAYRAQSTVIFQDQADTFATFQVTSTNHQQDWSLSAEGYQGGCFYKPAGGYSNAKYHLTSTRSFRPGPDTQLLFQAKYALAKDGLSVLVSTNNGSSFTPVWSATNTIREHWTDIRIPLAAYAGRDLLIRFEYLPGVFYPDRGVGIDEIRLVDVIGAEYLEGPVYHTSLTDLDKGINILAYQVWAGDQAQPRSESFLVDAGL